MLMFVLACPVTMMAQTGMSSDSSMKNSGQMGKTTTMTGCVSEKDGSYLLTNKNHPHGIQLTSSENLKEHVGHKVSVTGTMEKSKDAMKSNDKMSNSTMSHDSMSMGMAAFKVNSLKMVSTSCGMSNMSGMSH
jgi:hypothetical protein